jgi:hypothetical protein
VLATRRPIACWSRPGRTAAAAFAIAVIGLSLTATRAEAGFYQVAQCDPAFSVGQGAARFERSSTDFQGISACGGQGDGLRVNHKLTQTKPGRFGSWRIEAPRGTTLEALRAVAGARDGGGYAPSLLVALTGGGDASIGGIMGGADRVNWAGRGLSLTARLACARTGTPCARTADPMIRVKRLMLTLRDRVDPEIGKPGGSLLSHGSQRADRVLQFGASDVGTGIRRAFVEVNGEPVLVKDLADSGDCAIDRSVATALRPCPLDPTVSFGVDTSTSGGNAKPFRQGPNRLRTCVADQGLEGTANTSCRHTTVWVDNECPVAGQPQVERLNARFKHGGAKTPGSARVRQGQGATIVGSALTGAGSPVPGAELCVAERLKRPGAGERVIRERVLTGPAGRFKLHLDPGASRQIRIAHWSSTSDVKERHLRLNVKAKPGLRLSPSGSLANGQTLHFHVHLRGPGAGHRRVKVRVKPPGGDWQLISEDCIGRTGPGGGFSCRYRFEATTGVRTYAFRAVVSRQPGYPFLGGESPTRRKTVVGP